ncbi:AsmA family protein [Ensifer soli]|uniref:AsmA family protein n=1 Tax=Ciceribacter sp. sgz301302 TaxID=3342379 RepID=UPI0035B830CA
MLARILVSIGGLLVVALFAALIAPFFVDWTSFRLDFEREATRIMGKPVKVHGSVDARLIPFPSVTLNDVRVGAAEDGQPLIEVAHFSMDAELAPFLSGEALIFDMRLEQPKARIRLLPDGTLDWARGSRASIPAKTVVLENVSITDGSIDFIDEQTGRTRSVDGLNAELSARSLAGPWRIDGRAALDGEAGSFLFNSGEPDDKGVIGLKARLTPDKRPFGVELEGELKIVELKPLYQGTFVLSETRMPGEATEVGGDQPRAPRVTGKFELTNERIRVPEYRVEVGPVADPYVVTGEATLDTGQNPEFLLTADGQQIDVSRIGTTMGEAGKTGRDPSVSIRQRLAAMMAMAADIPIPQVPGRARLRLPAIVVGDTTVRDVTLDLRPDGAGWLIDNAVALFPGRTQIEAKGRLNLKGQRAFRGDLLVASNQPSGLAAWLAGSVDPAIRKLRTAGFSATVNLTDRLQQFERLEIAAGPATLTGRIERQSYDDQQPSLSMQLKGNRIDLEALQALTGLVAGDASTETVLSHAIAADISADVFTAFGEEARDVQAVLTLKNGQLQAERVSIGDLAGAKLAVSGRMSGTLQAPVVSAKMKLAAGDLGGFFDMLQRHASPHPMLARLAASGHHFADTTLDVTLAAGGKETGSAVTLGIMGMANGSRIAAQYSAPDIARALSLDGITVEATLENPSATVLLGQAGFDPLPFETEANGILSVRLQSTDGTKASGNLSLTTEGSSLAINGDVDLASSTFLDGKTTLTLQSRDLEPYLIVEGIGFPGMGAGLPVSVKASLETTPEQIAIAGLEGRADGNGFSGAVSIRRGEKTGAATGTLTLDTVDLAWIAEAMLGSVEDPSTGALATAPVGTPLFAGVDATLDLKAARVLTGITSSITDFTGKLLWRGDQAEIADAAGAMFGGKVAGRLLIGNGNGSGFIQSRLDITGGDLARTGLVHGGVPVASGTFNLALALEASGATAQAMAQSASGSGRLDAEGLVLRGLNSGALGAVLSAADRIEGEITPEAIAPAVSGAILSGETTLGTVGIPFTIAGGTLRAQNVTAADQAATLRGEVAVALPEKRIDATLLVTLAPGEEALAGAEPQVEIGYAGDLKAPGVTVDATELANFLSLRAYERERRRVETVQANVLEKQRLRREVALLKFTTETREAERVRALEEQRRRELAAEELKRQQAEAREAAERAEAERLRLEAEENARKAAAEAARQDAERKAAEARQAAEARRAEEDARRRAVEEERARRQSETGAQPGETAVPRRQMPVTPSEEVERGSALSPPQDRGNAVTPPFRLDTLPDATNGAAPSLPGVELSP